MCIRQSPCKHDISPVDGHHPSIFAAVHLSEPAEVGPRNESGFHDFQARFGTASGHQIRIEHVHERRFVDRFRWRLGGQVVVGSNHHAGPAHACSLARLELADFLAPDAIGRVGDQIETTTGRQPLRHLAHRGIDIVTVEKMQDA
jgi:hypothetical protein